MVDVLGNVEVEEQNEDIGTKLTTEEVVLKLHLVDEEVVEGSLARILQFESKITKEHLLESEITNILYNQVREQYGVECSAGRQVRRLLKKIVSLGMNSTGVDTNELPDITIVGDDEEEPAKKKTFGELFGTKKNQDSLILARQGSKGRIVSEVGTIIPAPNVFSTAMPEELALLLENIHPGNQTDVNECSSQAKKKRKRYY